MTNPLTLDQFYNNLIIFLEESKSDYVIIGGLAVSVIGEPRMTHDIDLILSIPENNIQSFLKHIINKGFGLDMQKLSNKQFIYMFCVTIITENLHCQKRIVVAVELLSSIMSDCRTVRQRQDT